MPRLAPIAVAMVFAAAAFPMHAQETDQARAGIQAAAEWLKLVDAGEGAASWTAAAGMFRGAIGQDAWASALTQARGPYGALTSRTVAKSRFTRTLPGAPEGDYVVISYQSVFANRPSAAETVVTVREAGGWKVTTYLVQ